MGWVSGSLAVLCLAIGLLLMLVSRLAGLVLPATSKYLIDEVIGNQEIVVKNTGPLLARVIGITGATVLGTGEIVLILNPVVLAQHERTAVQTPVFTPTAEPDAPSAPTVRSRSSS